MFLFEFCWLWIFSWIKLLWYYCSIWDKLERLDWLKQYHGEGLSFFNWKGYITQMHSLVVYVKEGLAFAFDSSLENSEYSYLCFQLALFCLVFCSFPSIDQCPHVCAQFLMLSSSGFLLFRELWSSFLAQFLLAFPQIQKECSFFIVQMVIILLLIDTVFVVIKEMFHGRMSVKLIPLLLLVMVNFVGGSRMKLIHIPFS